MSWQIANGEFPDTIGRLYCCVFLKSCIMVDSSTFDIAMTDGLAFASRYESDRHGS